jgi:hypothetical protein
MLHRGKITKNKDIKDKFVEVFKKEYNSFIIAFFSFGVSK